jgi:hypothetical protein
MFMSVPYEVIHAYALLIDGHYYLGIGHRAGELAASDLGSFRSAGVRYAFPRWGTLRPFFVTMAADDRGKLYKGLEAIDWISNNGLLFPRADAAGQWADGSEDQFVMKELDLAIPVQVFASASETDFPGLQVHAALEFVADVPFVAAPGGNFPARIQAAIPVFQVNAALTLPQLEKLMPKITSDPRVVSMDELETL